MLKSYMYIPQNFDDANKILVSLNESKCRILKQFIQHWLSERLGVRPYTVQGIRRPLFQRMGRAPCQLH